jgi:hypothetical protein
VPFNTTAFQTDPLPQRAVALSSNEVLTADDLETVPDAAMHLDVAEIDELVPLAEMERRAIMHALRETGGDRLAAETPSGHW